MSLTANLQIQPQVPSEFTPAVPSTSSDFVVSRRMREYTSDGARTYSYDGNSIIKFTINSADAFLDGRNSWIQFKLYSTYAGGDGGIAATDGERLSRYLETGGAHALFQRLRISLSNGTIISDYDYSQLYGMVRQYTMSFQHLQYQEGASSYDGMASDIYEYNQLTNKQVWTNLNVSQANCQLLTNTGASPSVVSGYDLTGLCRVGDELAFVVGPQAALNMPSVLYGKVVSMVAATSISVDFGTIATYVVGANAANFQAVYRLNRGDLSHRARGAQGVSATNYALCKIKLFSDFFNNIKYLPLPFLRNLTIELFMNRPAQSVVFAPIATTPTFAWTIDDPILVANLVTPSEALMNAYVEQYNSEQGIMLHWIDYQSNRITANTATTDSIRIPSNCHSALAVLVAQKLVESQSVVSGDTWRNDTNGNNVKQSLSTYQFQIGSEYFPFSRPVFCGDNAVTDVDYITNGNAWNYVLQALDSHGAKYECSSIVPNEYYAVNTIVRPTAGNQTSESLRFVLAARLDRDGNYTGVDTSNNDIQLNIVRLANPSAGMYYHAFIIHNRLIRISKSATIVFS